MGLRWGGKGAADMAVRMVKGRASSLTDQAIRGAVDQGLNVLEVAIERAKGRKLPASGVSLGVGLSLGLVHLSMQVVVPREGEPEALKLDVSDGACSPPTLLEG
jgi:hypothetical protein